MKKVLALTLVLVLAISMSTVAFAAAGQKVNKEGYYANWHGFGVNVTEVDLGTTYSPHREIGTGGTSFTFPLNAANFAPLVDLNSNDPGRAATSATLSTKEIKDSKMTAKFKATKGSQVIDEVKIDGSNVKVAFLDPFKSNNPDGVDYSFRVFLMVDGKNWSSVGITFTGTYKNATDDTQDADTDYFDFSNGVILKPSEFIRTLEGDLGCGITVNMRALKNAKYWGIANEDVSDADQDIMIKYSAVDAVYHTNTVNIANVANFVTLDDADPSSYVYDGNLNPLGRGNDKLPLVDTYYLASSALVIDSDEEPEEEEEEEEWEPGDFGGNSGTGGDDLYPENPHDNPGTGK